MARIHARGNDRRTKVAVSRKQLLGDLKRRDAVGSSKRKHQIAFCGELPLEEVMDLLLRQTKG